MKWSEFKKEVEDEIGEEDPEIGYIDVSFPNDLMVSINKDTKELEIL